MQYFRFNKFNIFSYNKDSLNIIIRNHLKVLNVKGKSKILNESEIGHEKVSETLLINLLDFDKDSFLCDRPGFVDNRGIEIEISNSI